MSSSAPPAVLNLAPKKTKLSTSSSSSSFTITVYSLAALNLMTFVLVMLIFKLVPLLALLECSFFNCSCLLVLDNSARSSAKSRSSNFSVNLHPRENDGTEREAKGVGRDMSCPRKLFLDERKSRFTGGTLFSETSACSLDS